MGAVNKIILIGNLGRDAEMRFTAGGTPVSNFSLATTEKWTDREGQKKEETQWHRVNLWGKTAEVLNEFLTKGKQVYVEGKMQYRKYTDKEGKEVQTAEVRADRIVLLSGGKDRPAGAPRDDHDQSRDYGGTPEQAPPDDDDIPF